MSFFNKSNNTNELSYNINPYNQNNNYILEEQQEVQNKYDNPYILIEEEPPTDPYYFSRSYFNDNIPGKQNDSTENLKLKLMEKDKLIFEYMKNEKESKKLILNLNQELSSKEEQNKILNEQIQKLKSNISDLEELNANQHNIISFNLNKNNENEIIIKLNEEKNDLIDEITKLKFIIQNHEDSIKKAVEELNNKEDNINFLKNELIKKNNFMNKNDEKKK